MFRRNLLAIVAASSLSVGTLAGCAIKSGSPETAPTSAEANPLAQLISDVAGSLRKTSESSAFTSATFSMTGTSEGVEMSGKGAISLDPLRVEMTVENPTEGSITIRIIDNTLYLQVPDKDRAEMDDKGWLKLDPGTAAEADDTGLNTSMFDDLDPIKQVKSLLASGQVTAVGEEKVNDVDTVHYRGTVSVDTYLQQVDAEYRESLRKQMEKDGVKEITTEVWVDAEYRPHRLHTAGGSEDMTIEYRDFNKPVTVTAPPAGETLDFGKMLEDLKNVDGN